MSETLANFNVFQFASEQSPVRFEETIIVKEGVICDVYKIEGDDTKDLAIVTVAPREKTPLQKVLKGLKTLEGYKSGEGSLTITRANGQLETYSYDNNEPAEPILVNIGDVMQWQAGNELVFYEICQPPYEDGRYENLEEN